MKKIKKILAITLTLAMTIPMIANMDVETKAEDTTELEQIVIGELSSGDESTKVDEETTNKYLCDISNYINLGQYNGCDVMYNILQDDFGIDIRLLDNNSTFYIEYNGVLYDNKTTTGYLNKIKCQESIYSGSFHLNLSSLEKNSWNTIKLVNKDKQVYIVVRYGNPTGIPNISDFESYSVKFILDNNITVNFNALPGNKVGFLYRTKEGYELVGYINRETGMLYDFDSIVKSDLVLVAVWEPIKYQVVFKDGDSIISAQSISYGTSAIAPKIEKEGYTLSWDKTFDNVTEELEVNAIWNLNKYNVVFKDGYTVVSTQLIPYGDDAIAPELYKEGYTLSWDKTFDNVTGALEINAIWTLNKYNVVFKNSDLVLKEQEVFYGYGAIAPEVVKEGYILSWDKSFSKITGDLIVNAVWTKEPCEVVFKNEGQVVDTQSVDYGTAAIAPALQKEGYTLSWDKSFDNVTEDLEINAVWTINSNKVIFKDGDIVLKEENVFYGYGAIAPEVAKEGYTLSWDKSFDNVTEDLEINAVWTINSYKVIFKDGDIVLKDQDVFYGYSAVAPELAKDGYTLSWDKSFNKITGDITVNAVWTVKEVETTTVKDEKQTETTTVKKETPTDKDKVAKSKVKKATKSKTSKKAKISLKKIKGASGYQVQISKKKNFKIVLVKKNVKKVTFTISSKKIKKVKTLYVRARVFIKKNGKTYYGDWSKAKKFNIKK